MNIIKRLKGQNYKINYKLNQGITLTGLVVTIIVLLILTGIAINFALGENGIIDRAKLAVGKYKQAEKNEKEELNNLYEQLSFVNNDSNNTNINELRLLIEQIVDNKLLAKYPVGSIYISENETNPSEFIGGEWENYAQGRTLIGQGEGNDGNVTRAFSAGETGGEYEHTLNIQEMPSHEGHLYTSYPYGIGKPYFIEGEQTGSVGRGWERWNANELYPASRSIGGSQPHNNIQPYITVYMWKRIS